MKATGLNVTLLVPSGVLLISFFLKKQADNESCYYPQDVCSLLGHFSTLNCQQVMQKKVLGKLLLLFFFNVNFASDVSFVFAVIMCYYY